MRILLRKYNADRNRGEFNCQFKEWIKEKERNNEVKENQLENGVYDDNKPANNYPKHQWTKCPNPKSGRLD